MTRPSWTLERYEALPSTNDHLKAAAKRDAAGRLVVVAEHQTDGRGRGTKRWESPRGGLYASVLLREVPDDLRPLLAFVAGEALVRTLKVLDFRSRAWLKWPNDLLVAPGDAEAPVGKAAGILVETVSRGARLDHAVVGIGVNLASDPGGLPQGQEPPAVSFRDLEERLPDPQLFLEVFLSQLDHVLTYFARAPAALVQAVQKRLAWAGERVVVQKTDGGTVEGTLLGLSTAGGLRVDTDDGEQVFEAWDVASLDRAA